MEYISNGFVKNIVIDDLKGSKTILFFYPKANTPG